MYTSLRGISPDGTEVARRVAGGRRAVSTTVVLLGLTSLFTDVSSEMVAAILPVYITLQLGLSPLQFGVVDGLYQGATAIFRLAAGYLSDRTQRPKIVATIGYALSAVCKLALLPATGLLSITGVIMVDRGGKGIRTAPRDAMIASASPPWALGRAFGAHRALDTVGAMAGPLLAFFILSKLPGAYHAVFVTSFCFAIIGVAIIALLVRDPSVVVEPVSPRSPRAPSVRPRMREALALLRDRAVLKTCLCAGALAMVTVSDGFIYLTLQRREAIPVHLFPLMFLATSAGYLALAMPVGRLADRLGKGLVFLSGHVLLLVAYLVAVGPGSGAVVVVVTLLMLGAYYAATDGVLSALTSTLIPERLRSSGLALVQTIVAVGKLASAVVFGAVWTLVGRQDALLTFAAALAITLLVVTPFLIRMGEVQRA